MLQRSTHARAANSSSKRGSRERILEVALLEFSERGFSGARVDRIAKRANTSKHMLYYHFSSKTGLYEAVLKDAYSGVRAADATIDVDHMDPVDALRSIVSQSFNYHCDHEVFVRLVMNENIQYAANITDEQADANKAIIEELSSVLLRGQADGVFRSDIDARQVHLTISALGFHYVSNKYTFSRIFEFDMHSTAAREQRCDLIVDIVLRWCAAS